MDKGFEVGGWTPRVTSCARVKAFSSPSESNSAIAILAPSGRAPIPGRTDEDGQTTGGSGGKEEEDEKKEKADLSSSSSSSCYSADQMSKAK